MRARDIFDECPEISFRISFEISSSIENYAVTAIHYYAIIIIIIIKRGMREIFSRS